MKRKTLSSILIIALAVCISACGAKKDIQSIEEETVTETETNEVVAQADEEINEADEATKKFEAFLAGEEKVYVDKYDYIKRSEDGDYTYFGDYQCMTKDEFFKQVVETEKLGSFSFPFDSAQYAYIDCGLDGIPELVMKATFEGEWDQVDRYYVIKLVDDKLELTYMDESYSRSFLNITNLAGVIEEAMSAGAANNAYQLGFLDADARYVLDYYADISYTAIYMLPERFDDAVANTQEDYSELYLRRYAFELNTDGNDFAEYEKRTLYCAQKEADEESNGLDFKENERIAKVLFDYAGEKIYSLDDIKAKIAEREANIGFSDKIKNAGEFGWSDLEVDYEYINGIEVIHVSNVDELMKNLADNTTIVLAPGEYNIGEWVKKNASNLPYYDGDEEYEEATDYDGGVYVEDGEGVYFSISYLNDCTLRSEKFDNPAVIVNTNPDCNVLNLNKCENITFNRIFFKNNAIESEYICSTLAMSRCRGMNLDYCKIDGNKITMGISMYDSSSFYAEGCEIVNCDDGFVQTIDSYDVTFANSTISDITGDVLIQTMGGAITFANSEFKNLSGTLVYPERVNDTDFVNCEFDEATKDAYEAIATAEEVSVDYLRIDSLDCFRWEGPLHLYIMGANGILYHLDDNTVLSSGLPCNDDGCDPLLWASRYIDHSPITDESDSNGKYYCLGFGGTEVWEIRVDDNNNIKSVVDIYAAD